MFLDFGLAITGRGNSPLVFIMKYIIILFLFLSVSLFAYADKIQIPFSCYPKELQKVFKDNGIKLDLDGNERDKDVLNWISSKGRAGI